MPELPEVEVVKRGLEVLVGDGAVIDHIECLRKDLREEFPLRDFSKLKGALVQRIYRRAKYLIIETNKGSLLSHLGMTGAWRMTDSSEEMKHDHVYIHFKNRERFLAYRDPRRFGYLGFFKNGEGHRKLAELGPEPLESEFTAAGLLAKLKGRTAPIKIGIMDQKVVVGVGNIYASEALHLAGINPLMEAGDLDLKSAQKLVKEIKKILTQSIDRGGSTISDFVSSEGGKGYFQNTFKVYDREGKVCFSCKKAKIKKMVIGGRSSFWCPFCQK